MPTHPSAEKAVKRCQEECRRDDEPSCGNAESSLEVVLRELAAPIGSGHIHAVGTVTEIKFTVGQLPPRKQRALARWWQAQVDDRPSDEEMMAIAAEGARALDKREAV